MAGEYDATDIDLPGNCRTVFGNNVILELGNDEENVRLGIEICEDAWTPVAPSRLLAVNGAEIIINISASNEVIGKEQYRRTLEEFQHRVYVDTYIIPQEDMNQHQILYLADIILCMKMVRK